MVRPRVPGWLLSLVLAVFAAADFMALGPTRPALADAPPPQYPIVFVPGTAASYLLAPNSSVLGLPPYVYWFSGGQLITNQLGSGNCVPALIALPCINQINPRSDLMKLALHPDGSDTFPVQVGDIFRELDLSGNWGPGVQDVYQTLMQNLGNLDYHEGGGPNNWLYVAPYDWRKSPTYNAQAYVLPQVLQAERDHPGRKVVLLAHSQGGLVARAFVAGNYVGDDGKSFQGGDKVAALVAIATPWLGTPRVTQAASVGWDFGIAGMSAQWGPVLAPNWPSVYAMMPADDQYFANYRDGYYYDGGGKQGNAYGEPAQSPAEQAALISASNTQAGGHLMADALQERASYLNGDSYNVNNYLIVGYIKPDPTHQIPLASVPEDPTDTILRVVRYQTQGYHCVVWCWTFPTEQDYVDVGAGDNTIPLASALAWQPAQDGPLPAFPGPNTVTPPQKIAQSVIGPFTYYVVGDLDGNGNSATRNAKHMHLPNNTHVKDTIAGILQNLVTVTSSTLPPGTLGEPYSAKLAAMGGTGGYTWAPVPGALDGNPQVFGLTLDPDGTLHGTIMSNPLSLDLTVTDSAGNTATGTVDIPVQIPGMSLDPLPATDAGQWYDQVVQARGGVAPVVTQQTGLPAWISVKCFVIGTCEFQGAPPAVGKYAFKLQLTDQGPGTQIWQDEVLTVNPAPVVSPSAAALGTIRLQVGQQLLQQFTAHGGTAPYSWVLLNEPSWLRISSGGQVSGTPTACGRWTPTVDMQDAVGVQIPVYLTVQATAAPPEITTEALPAAVAGQEYSATVQGTGGCPQDTWSLSTGSLPAGVTLGTQSGMLTGVPQASGTYTFTLGLRDAAQPAQTATRQYVLNVAAPLTVSTTTLPGGTVGVPYTATLAAAGGYPQYTWSIGHVCTAYCSPPPGPGGYQGSMRGAIGSAAAPPAPAGALLALGPSGPQDPRASATDPAAEQADAVLVPAPAASGALLALGPVGPQQAADAGPTPAGADLLALNRATPYTPVYTAALPDGLTLDPQGGTITGTPKTAGVYHLDLVVTDSQRFGGSRLLTLTIASGTQAPPAAAPTVTALSPASGPSAGGTVVTVTGTGLSGATAVDFGATAGTGLQVEGDTQLRVTAPPGTGTVGVTVTTPAGTGTGVTYTYQASIAVPPGGTTPAPGTQGGGTTGTPVQAAPATPVVTAITPASGPDGGGQTVTVSGSGLTGATSVSFGDFGQGQDVRVAADGRSLTVTTPEAWWGDGPTYVVVTTPSGSSSGAVLYTYVPGAAVPSSPPGSGASGSGGTPAPGGVSPGAGTQSGGTAGSGGTTQGGTTQGGAAAGPPVVTGISPASGPDRGGQTVTITGSGLGGATGVSFGDFGQGQDIQVAADGRSLTVVTPEAWWGDGPTYVQVTTPAGSSSGAVEYTYTAG